MAKENFGIPLEGIKDHLRDGIDSLRKQPPDLVQAQHNFFEIANHLGIKDEDVGCRIVARDLSSKPCRWLRVKNEGDYWETDCNNAFITMEGDLIDNKFKFCPYCGKRILEVIDDE